MISNLLRLKESGMKRIYIFFISFSLAASGFTTLKEFTQYAQTVPEYPDNDTTDWENPDYTQFYKQSQQTFKKKLIELARLERDKQFPVEHLQSLLHEVTENLQKMSEPGRLIKKVLVDTGAQFYIWGELNGAFHSLVRTLNELKALGVIDNNFRLLNPKVHFAFIGDVLNRSPYMIETAFLILRLMQANPRCQGRGHESVFFLKGKVEDKQEWISKNLGKELVQRTANQQPLIDAFTNFFHTVPLAIYILPEDQTGDVRQSVRISYYGPNYSELDENNFLHFFDYYAPPVMGLTQKKLSDALVSIKIRAYIYSGSFEKKISRKGLTYTAKNPNAPAEWHVFSSPTANSRRLYEFFDDAFVVLNVVDKNDLDTWTLTLFRQNTRSLNGFTQDQPLYLLSGKPVTDEKQEKIVALQQQLAESLADIRELKKSCTLPRVASAKQDEPSDSDQAVPQPEGNALQGDRFVIGSTMDLSRLFKMYGERLKQGLNLPIEAANNQGGIAGKKIQIVYMDDGYEPAKALANIEKIISDLKTNIILSPFGSAPLATYLDLIKQKKVSVLFPITGSFRDRELKYLIHLRASYVETGRTLAAYVADMLKNKKIAFLYQNDSWGKDLLKGAKDQFEKDGNTNFLELSYQPNSISIDQQIEEIRKFNPDGIAFFCAPRIAQECIKQLGVEFLQKKTMFGDTVLGQQDFTAFLQEKGLKMIRLQVVPNPLLSQLQIVKEFREYAKAADVPLDITSLEGYLNAAVFVEVMGRVEGEFTLEKLIKAFEDIKDYDFKGLKLNFDPHTRQLLHTVWMNTNNDDWPEQEIVPAEQKDEASQPQTKIDAALSQANAKPLTSEQANVLKIGSTMDLSKGVKGLSEGYKGGMMLKVQDVNASGGVNSLTFQLNVADDLYEPQRARANILEMIKDLQIDLFLAPLGTPTTKAYLQLIEEGQILVLFPIARSDEFRRPDLVNLIQYQPSLKQEAKLTTKFVLDKHKIAKLAVFYQNDDFGLEPKEAIEALVKAEYPQVELASFAYERNNVNFKEQVEKIKNFKPDALALHATSSVVEEFVRQIGPQFLHGRVLYGGSWLMVDQLLKAMQEKGLFITLLSSMPDPEGSTIELAEDFRKAARNKGDPINVIYFEGYLYMSLLAQAVKEIELPLTKEKIINYFQGLKNIDYKGLKLNFNPENRTVIKNVWIYQTKDGSWTELSV